MSSKSKKIVNMILNKVPDAPIQSDSSLEHGSKLNIISNLLLKPPVDIIVPSRVTTKCSISDVNAHDAEQSNQLGQTVTRNGNLDRPGPSRYFAERVESESEDDPPREPFEDSLSSYQPSADDDESDLEIGPSLPKNKRHEVTKPAEDILLQTKKQKQRKKRSRKANKEEWHRTINKKVRMRGQKYVNCSGKEIPEKKPKEVPCTKCRYKCQEKNI